MLKSRDDDLTLKIADFGFAVIDNNNDTKGQAGSLLYMAPEIIHRTTYGKAVDLWSIGVITFVLLGGYPPFQDNDMKRMVMQICAGNYEFHNQFWSNISAEAKDFISKLLIVDPRRRMTTAEAINHSWLQCDDLVLATHDLGENLTELKKFNARRHFKKWVYSIVAVNRFSNKKRKLVPDGGSEIKLSESSSCSNIIDDTVICSSTHLLSGDIINVMNQDQRSTK